MLATGYDLDYPFIDPAEINWQDAAPQLYLNAFHPQADDVFVMGMVEASGLGWEGRNKQAELAALYLRQLRDGAASAQRFKQLKQQRCGQRLDGGYAYLQLDRMAYYVNKQEYLDALNGHIAELKTDLANAVAA